MSQTPVRKLAVLLHADVVGSTLLVQKNETLAHERIQTSFRQLTETIRKYGGTAHEIRGDALVAEFRRASDSVCAALAFQIQNSADKKSSLDPFLPALRIGISLGEVVIADGTVTGAGVVLAQRLEQLAEKNGVVVHGTVADTVPTRFPFIFESLGDQSLKGFEQPVRAFSAQVKIGESIPEAEFGDHSGSDHDQAQRPKAHDNEDVTRSTIAVLPFDNMSDDLNQAYFCDGISEDLITELAHIPSMFVIARHSSFVYKNKAKDVRRIGQKLGARYVVEGSVRRVSNRIRITAQLIDSNSGTHLWAKRYDREIDDVFEVQDDVVRSIVLALRECLQRDIPIPAEHTPTGNIEAYEWLVKGRQNVFRAQGRAESRHALHRAVELDPDLSDAYAWLAVYHYSDWAFYHEHTTEDSMEKAIQSAQKAIQLSPQSALAHMSLGIVKLYIGKREEALAALYTALDLKPNDADVLVFIQEAYTFNGEPEKGIASVQLAMRLNPHFPEWYLWHLGFAYYASGQYENAIDTLQKVSDIVEPRRILAAALAMVGRIDEARAMGREFMSAFPDFSIESWARTQAFKHSHELNQFIEGYHLAGLAE